MTNSELKFVAKVFSRICNHSSHCIHYLYTDGCRDDEGCYGGDTYDLLADSFYKGVIDDCPIENTELKCVDCTEQAWYKFLQQMEKKHSEYNKIMRKREEERDD